MSNNKPLRAFLAIEPPSEVLREIGNIQNMLKKACRADFRWVRPGGIHLTLKFFGDISETDVEAISRTAKKHASATPPLCLEASILGLFPSLKRPRVIWIGLHGDIELLASLQKNLERDFAEGGFAGEDKPFRPHLTLARIKTADERTMAAVMETGKNIKAGTFHASGMGIFKSDLTPQGAIYTKLAWFPFEGKVT